MKRRKFLTTAALGGAAMVLPGRNLAQNSPARVPAQPAADPRTRRILDIAREQIARAGAPLWRRDTAAVVDFGVHSATPRLHIADLESGRVDSLLVTHGQGSDPDHDGWLDWFSNVPDSLCTSRGAYISWQWYQGRYGSSMRLGGLDDTNSNAYPRAIVMHPAEYATQEFVDQWGVLGRSNGCLAIAPADIRETLLRLGGGRLIYADALGIQPDGSLQPRELVKKDLTEDDFVSG